AADIFGTLETETRAVGDAAGDLRPFTLGLVHANVGDTVNLHAGLGQNRCCQAGEYCASENLCLHYVSNCYEKRTRVLIRPDQYATDPSRCTGEARSVHGVRL